MILKQSTITLGDKSNKFPEPIMERLRLRQGLAPSDVSKDKMLNQMSKNEAFDETCDWEGLINYGSTIRRWIKQVYGIDLEEVK